MAACFLPCKINLVLQKKKKVCQKYPNFKRGDPYDLGRRPLQPVRNYKSQSFLSDPSPIIGYPCHSLTNFREAVIYVLADFVR